LVSLKVLLLISSLREAYEVGANTEACTLARRRADAGGVDVQDSERGQGNEGNHADLGQLEALAGEEVGRNGYSQALKGVLHGAGR